jgi:hypothetical protein
METTITAQVILRMADGRSILDTQEPIVSDNIHKYKVEEETILEASQKLESLGFEVLQPGPTGFTISSSKNLFERTFQTKLETRQEEIMDTKVPGQEAQYYEAVEPINIPSELSSIVASVALTRPPELFY